MRTVKQGWANANSQTHGFAPSNTNSSTDEERYMITMVTKNNLVFALRKTLADKESCSNKKNLPRWGKKNTTFGILKSIVLLICSNKHKNGPN